jgi:propionyl-CoA synthetase
VRIQLPAMALAEGRDPGDLTTIDDPSTLEQIRSAIAGN